MKKMIASVLTAAMVLSSSAAFAQNVYVTKNGKKYHQADCKFIQKSSPMTIALADAQKKGIKPCGACFKESAKAKPSDNVNLVKQP